jgi:hypothetical protein
VPKNFGCGIRKAEERRRSSFRIRSTEKETVKSQISDRATSSARARGLPADCLTKTRKATGGRQVALGLPTLVPQDHCCQQRRESGSTEFQLIKLAHRRHNAVFETGTTRSVPGSRFRILIRSWRETSLTDVTNAINHDKTTTACERGMSLFASSLPRTRRFNSRFL